MILLLREIGRVLAERQEQAGWGNFVVAPIARDLRQEFPGMTGLSRTNIFERRRFYRFTKATPNCATACCTNSLKPQPLAHGQGLGGEVFGNQPQVLAAAVTAAAPVAYPQVNTSIQSGARAPERCQSAGSRRRLQQRIRRRKFPCWVETLS